MILKIEMVVAQVPRMKEALTMEKFLSQSFLREIKLVGRIRCLN